MPVKELASVDGRISPTVDATIPLPDDGLYRGDGVFEVIRLYAGRPFALGDHLDRRQVALLRREHAGDADRPGTWRRRGAPRAAGRSRAGGAHLDHLLVLTGRRPLHSVHRLGNPRVDHPRADSARTRGRGGRASAGRPAPGPRGVPRLDGSGGPARVGDRRRGAGRPWSPHPRGGGGLQALGGTGPGDIVSRAWTST